MKRQNRKFDKQRGAALILVVVVTVLLAVIGVMFLMVSRLSEMESVAVADERDLTGGVDTVVGRINEVLVKDLFGNNKVMIDQDALDEPYDFEMRNYRLEPGLDGLWNTSDDRYWYPGVDGKYGTGDDVYQPRLADDNWLASLEPAVGLDGSGNPVYLWSHITDLYDNNFGVPFSPVLYYDPQNELTDPTEWSGAKPEFVVDAENTLVKVISPKDRTYVIQQGAANWSKEYAGARADADGDGVADSRWVKVPGVTTSRGKDVFAAVRIIDNCAMLNLNTAGCFDVRSYADPKNTSPFKEAWNYWYENPVNTFTSKPWHSNQGSGSGRYLTEINYLPFLRGKDLNGNLFAGTAGGDFWYNLMMAKGFYKLSGGNPYPFAPDICQNILMNIESPGNRYQLFGIGDELELRNRYLVTSKVESRFEQKDIANFSLDSGGGVYSALKVPRDSSNDFDDWTRRIDPVNFDAWSGALAGNEYVYDRRHVCTFYSFDRNLRKGAYPLLEMDLSGIANAALREQIRSMLIPKGAVTTNLISPDEILKGAAGKPYNNLQTRKRIVHLLYALREYYYNPPTVTKSQAALKAAQVVSNLIDFSDNDAPNTLPIRGATEGPFYEAAYGTQANVDGTFITEDIIEKMINEVSGGLLPVGSIAFGLNPAPTPDIVFGYERQPFISEVYAQWNGAPLSGNPKLEGFAIELINPYNQNINLTGWRLIIGSTVNYQFVSTDPVLTANTRLVIRTTVNLGSGNTVPVAGGALYKDLNALSSLEGIYPGGDFSLKLLRPAPSNSGISELYADYVSSSNTRSVLGTDGRFSLQRDDDNWKFVYGKYAPVITIATSPYNLGAENSGTIPDEGFQLAVADDENPLCRWHELETLSLYGNGAGNSTDPNAVLTTKLTASSTSPKHLDLAGVSGGLLDYLCTINRPDVGSLPGRINFNTAPVHVIAAAIPPVLADPNAADPTKTVTFSALQLAEQIVKNRPYGKLSDLLTRVSRFKQYTSGGARASDNVGSQSIDNDIEERDWILSNLANKFTVRSDTFTAYILVRLGEDGPQRRMIGIFDRSQVWKPTDRPQLVALHPVPDPR